MFLLVELTVADTIEACIVTEVPAEVSDKLGNRNGSAAQFTIKIQGKHGQRDVTNITTDPNKPLGTLYKPLAYFQRNLTRPTPEKSSVKRKRKLGLVVLFHQNKVNTIVPWNRKDGVTRLILKI